MSAQPISVAIRPGQGIVQRTGAGVLVVLPGGDEAVQDQLLTAFADACRDQSTPGRSMARKLVGLLSQNDPEAVPSFGACAPNERGWAVILHQGVTLHVEHEGQAITLSGFDASTWVDRIVDDGFSSLTLVADGEDVGPIDTRFRLDGGMIPGAGATVTPADAPMAQPGAGMAEGHGGMGDGDGGMGDGHGAMAPQPAPADPAPHQQAQPAQAPPAQFQPVQPAPPQAPPAQPAPPQAPNAPAPPQYGGQAPAAGPPPGGPPPAASAGQHGGIVQQPAPQQPAPQPAAQQPAPQPPPAPHPMPAEEEEPPTLIQSSSDRAPEPVPASEDSEPEELPSEDVPFESVPLLDIDDSAKRDPLAVLTADTPKEEISDASAPLVYGVLSPSGYFNHPDALFCAVTGVSMLHRTHVLVQRPRPPLGVVVADDGSTFTLDANYVVGREPERDPQVEADEARPLKLQDAERSLSRVHAEIRLMDWDVAIVDRGSANGTYVLPRGGQQWKRLVADTPEVIVPGTRVAFGKRVMTYESHHQINQAAAS